MKKLALLLIAVAGLLSACIGYEVPNHDRGEYRGDNRGDYRDDHRGEYRDEHRGGDRDHDGIPDSQDRHPDDSRR